jgi:hypothetical protein
MGSTTSGEKPEAATPPVCRSSPITAMKLNGIAAWHQEGNRFHGRSNAAAITKPVRTAAAASNGTFDAVGAKSANTSAKAPANGADRPRAPGSLSGRIDAALLVQDSGLRR